MGYNLLLGMFEAHINKDATLDGLDAYLNEVSGLLEADLVDPHEVTQAWEVIYTIINHTQEQSVRTADALRARMGYIRRVVELEMQNDSRSTERHGSDTKPANPALD